MDAGLISALGAFGTPGLLGILLVWDRMDRRTHDRERSEADKALASALTAMTVTLQHIEQRLK